MSSFKMLVRFTPVFRIPPCLLPKGSRALCIGRPCQLFYHHICTGASKILEWVWISNEHLYCSIQPQGVRTGACGAIEITEETHIWMLSLFAV